MRDPECVDLNSVVFQLGNLDSDRSSVAHFQLEIHNDMLEMESHEDFIIKH